MILDLSGAPVEPDFDFADSFGGSLFGSEAPAYDRASDYDDAARRAGIFDEVLNPCKGCPFRGLCDSDDCAMKLYDIDQPEAPKFDDYDDDDF